MKATAKLWVLVVLCPFIVLGAWEAHSKEDQHKSKILMRDLERGQAVLIRNARIFTGTGKVIETGAVLVRNGKVAAIYEGVSPEAKDLKAEAIDAASAGHQVGYESASQFSREYGRLFGAPPRRDLAQLRGRPHEDAVVSGRSLSAI